ncbi:hypothetical protein M758_8G168000 [Ceratodon purpureus]|nr:hypothetical protein M758_8G168000 [Ceratodon purpureus]
MKNARLHLIAHWYRCQRAREAARRWHPLDVREYSTRHTTLSRSRKSLGVERLLLSSSCLTGGSTHIDFGKAHGIHSATQGTRAPARWETYDPVAFQNYYRYRPLSVAFRAMTIVSEIAMLTYWHFVQKDIQKRADKLRRSLIRLGPFYIKLGQALSTRPDVLPNAYCLELAKLQDRIPPFPTPEALKFFESQFGLPASEVFAEISKKPIAAASLGQVYRARLHSGEAVAVKVQRPGIPEVLALDAHLLRLLGGLMQGFAGTRGDLVAVVDEMVGHMFEEVDYIKEGNNAERFAELYGLRTPSRSKRSSKQTHHQRPRSARQMQAELYGNSGDGVVKVPKIYWDYTTKGVLTMEWIDGIKLTDRDALRASGFDIQHLVDQGVLSSLRQLLEEGYFHADPHPGNVVVTREGGLAYFDFGMMSELRREYRIGLIRTLIHFVNRDSEGLARDFVMLDFIPDGTDLEPVARELRLSFGDEGTKVQMDFQGVMNQLWTVMYKFQFRLSPEYAMVVRALGSLEGTATTLDPGFQVVASAYPFIVGRLLADPDPQMRETLRELLIRNNGSIRWHRLERLVVAVADQSAPEASATKKEKDYGGQDGLGHQRAGGIRGAFDSRAVASATLDVMNFILSGEGHRIRVLLVKDIVRTCSAVLKHYYLDTMELEKAPLYPGESLKSDPPVQQEEIQNAASSSKWKDFARNLYRESVFVNPLSWSKARLLRLWSSRQGMWSSNRKDTESLTNVGDLSELGGGQRAHSQSPRALNLGPLNVEKNYRFRADDHQTTPMMENFPGRVQAGLVAFVKAVEANPEVWLPLMAQLAAKPEARALGCEVAAALAESYCSETAEAFFLYISKQLHEES